MYTGITKCFKFEEGTAKGAARTYLQGLSTSVAGRVVAILGTEHVEPPWQTVPEMARVRMMNALTRRVGISE